MQNLKSFAFELYIESTRLLLCRRRHRLRCARAAGAVGVGGGCMTPPPPPKSASAAAAALLPRGRCSGRRAVAVPPTSAARLCRQGPSLATAWPWLTDAQWCRHIRQNIKHSCNPIPVCCCISIAILQPGGTHNFIGKGIYQVYTRYRMAFHMTGIYQINDRYMTNGIYLANTCHMTYLLASLS